MRRGCRDTAASDPLMSRSGDRAREVGERGGALRWGEQGSNRGVREVMARQPRACESG